MGEKVRMWTPETFQTEMEYSIPREIMSCHVFRLIIELQLHYVRANADNALFPFCLVGFSMSSAQNKIWEPRYIHEY